MASKDPLPTIASTISKELRQWRQLLMQYMHTQAGLRVKLAVGNGATTVTYTFSSPDYDDNYGIVATPTWSTTVRVSARSITAFTLTFGTAAGASDTVDVMSFRGS